MFLNKKLRCGACKRYKPMIIEIAKSTKGWHAKVMRVSVINCGDSFNEEICRLHNINHYPTLKLFPARAKYSEKDTDRGGKPLQLDSTDHIISQMAEFIEKQHEDEKRPPTWPDLEPFVYDIALFFSLYRLEIILKCLK